MTTYDFNFHRFGFLALALATCASAGCLGNTHPGGEISEQNGSNPNVPGASACINGQEGPRQLRRFTGTEYNRTLVDLFGNPNVPQADFFTSVVGRVFNNDANQMLVDTGMAQLLMLKAEEISSWATQNLSHFAPCTEQTDDCAANIIATVGKRAFRRPMSADDTSLYTQLYNTGKADGGFTGGVQLALTGMLQSPYFLYRFEVGQPAGPQGHVYELDPYEVASELSYYLTGSMPDPQLMQAADANALSSPEQLRAQAERLLTGPKQVALHDFMFQLLNLGTITSVTKDPNMYPKFNAAIGQEMAQETDHFLTDVAFNKNGTFADLFAEPSTWLNGDLANYYGMPAAANGNDFAAVPTANTPRAPGILGQGSVLTTNADFARSSPVLRGKLMRTHLFCETIPPPPAGVPTALAPAPNAKTTREVFAQHERTPSCAGCHQLLDSTGNGFENFDGAGVYRSQENGETVDTTGSINGIFAQPHPFKGLNELSEVVGSSSQARDCFSYNLMNYAYGLSHWEQDSCTLAAIDQAAAPGNYRLQDLLLAVTAAPTFYRRVAQP